MSREAVWVEVVDFPGGETDAALEAELEDGRRVWLPWSQLDSVERHPLGGGRVLVSAWLARKEDLE